MITAATGCKELLKLSNVFWLHSNDFMAFKDWCQLEKKWTQYKVWGNVFMVNMQTNLFSDALNEGGTRASIYEAAQSTFF